MPTCRQAGVVAGGPLALVTLAAAAGPFEDGIAALQRSDFAAAIRLLRPLAEKRNADAQFNMGWMYANGKGVPQDINEAVVWYQKAAEQGNAYAEGPSGCHTAWAAACLKTTFRPFLGPARLPIRVTLWRSITSAEHMTKDSACLRTISKPSFGTERLLTRGTRML